MEPIRPIIEPSWGEVLKDEFQSPYFYQLKTFLVEEKKQYTVYPKGSDIFNAFKFTPFNDVRVVLIGQDPYHEPKQAEGLCFSVADGVPFPPSLRNIFQEIHDELGIHRSQSRQPADFLDHGDLPVGRNVGKFYFALRLRKMIITLADNDFWGCRAICPTRCLPCE